MSPADSQSPAPKPSLIDPSQVDPADIAPQSRAGLSRRSSLAGAAGLALAPMAPGALRPIEVGRTYRSSGRSLTGLTSLMGVTCPTSTAKGPYGQRDQVLAALKTLGVTFIRSRIFMGNKGQITWTNQLAANGFKTNAVMGDPTFKAGTPEQLVSLIATSFPNAVHSMEGANEWNLDGGSNWASELRNHQTRIWNAAKANPRPCSKPVVGPALGMRKGYEEFGNQSAIMDWGNIHLYTGGFVPGYRTDDVIAEERRVCGSKPIILTETGWHNAKNYKGTHNYTPEDVAGVYSPRLLLEYFVRNVPKMSIYEIIDEPADPGMTDHEAHFGLLRTDWSPKPAFVSLANLNVIMNRQYRTTGRAGAPLEFSFREGPSDLRSCLLARSDGRYLLFLWRSLASIYDPNKRIRLTPTTTTAELDWGANRSVNRFVPSLSSNPVATEVTSRSIVPMKAELQILEISPA
jgi:hypothetical protein